MEGGRVKFPLVTPLHAVLTLTMRHKVSRHQLHPTVWALYLPLQPLPVQGSDPCHTLYVRRLRQYNRGLSWTAGLAHCLLHIRVEADPLNEICENVEFSLQPLLLGQRNYPII